MESEKKTCEWSGVPNPPADWTWERKTRVLFQTHSRNYYLVPEVVSSLEKAILLGNVEDAFYWTVEYVTMGDQFIVSAWSHLFLLAANSVGPADPTLLTYMWEQYNTADQAYRKLADKEEEDDEAPEEDDSDSGTIDPHRLTILLETVRRMCQTPKSRSVDSIVRTFLMPYPPTSTVRPYEPYRDQLHLRMLNDEPPTGATRFSDTQIRSLSFIPEYQEGVEPTYGLFQLQESDPPYLAPWANALVYLLKQVHDLDLSSEGEDVVRHFQTLERGVLYYAGLIYQCTEPAPHNKKLNATYILWGVIDAFKTEVTTDLINTLRKISDEISKHDNRRERPFLALALLITIRPWCVALAGRLDEDGDLVMPDARPHSTGEIDLAALFEQNANEILEVSVSALDYTTPEGKARHHTVSDYLITVQELIEQSPYDSRLPDSYADMAYQLECAREAAHIKDQKKSIDYFVNFFRFNPDTVKPEDGEEPPKKNRRKPKTPAHYNLTSFYTLPLDLFHPKGPEGPEEGEVFTLPWRGQFIPYQVDPNTNTSGPHVFKESFFEVTPVTGSKLKEGLFLATYKHPRLGVEQDVFFVCCTGPNAAKQVFYQCMVDELKVIFGVPSLGTHCLYLDHCLEKTNKKAEWAQDNFEIVADRGCHVVMFPVTAFGFETRAAAALALSTEGGNLQDFSVEALTTPFVHKAKAPFLTTEFLPIRQQVTNIYMFYACLGISKGALSKMMLVPPAGQAPVNLQHDKPTAGVEGEQERTESLALAAAAKVVPFYEMTAFTNQPFPEIFKKVRQTLLRALLIGDQAYYMSRLFDLMMHLDWDGVEMVLQRFGAPAVEWTSVIRNNLRDVRCGWLLWSQHSEANQMLQRQKNQEKNRARLERKRAAKDTKGDEEDDEENQDNEEGEQEKPKKTKRVRNDDDDVPVPTAPPTAPKKSKVILKSAAPSKKTVVTTTKKAKMPPITKK